MVQKEGVDIMNDKLMRLKYLPAIVDACIIIIAYLLAYYLRFYSPLFPDETGYFYPFSRYAVFLFYIVPAYLLIYFEFRLYSVKSDEHKWQKALFLTLANIVGMVLFVVMLYFRKEYNISRKFLLLFIIINVVLGIASRMIMIYLVRLKQKRE